MTLCNGKSAGHTDAKESILSSSVSLLEPGRVESGLRLFPVSSFHSSTYISPDIRWCNPRKQV